MLLLLHSSIGITSSYIKWLNPIKPPRQPATVDIPLGTARPVPLAQTPSPIVHRIPQLVKREGHQLDPASLKDFLKANLAGYKVPSNFIVVEELPKSSTGKLLKREIRNWAL